MNRRELYHTLSSCSNLPSAIAEEPKNPGHYVTKPLAVLPERIRGQLEGICCLVYVSSYEDDADDGSHAQYVFKEHEINDFARRAFVYHPELSTVESAHITIRFKYDSGNPQRTRIAIDDDLRHHTWNDQDGGKDEGKILCVWTKKDRFTGWKCETNGKSADF